MSIVVSPKTGKLVKVGSKAFSDLLADPKYAKTILTSPSSPKTLPPLPKTLPPLPSPKKTIPPLSPKKTFSSSKKTLPPLSAKENLPKVLYKNITELPPLPSSPLAPMTTLPPLPSSPSKSSKLPPLPSSPTYSSKLPPLVSPSKLPPLPSSPTYSSKLPSPSKLPPLPSSPTYSSKSSKLPPLPSKTSTPSPVYSPPSPSSSLENIPLPMLPPITNVYPLPTTPSVYAPLDIPLKKPLYTLPPLPANIVSKLPNSSLYVRELPPLKEKEGKEELVKEEEDENLNEILAMGFLDIPTLKETLKKTTQPAKRAKLEKMIKEKKYNEKRGIKSRGWDARAPQGKERHELHSKCGDKCFLLPEEEKFPICASPKFDAGCKIDCGGVMVSKARAKQHGYDAVAKNADALLKECNKEGLKHFTPSEKVPSPKMSPKLSPSMYRAGKMDKYPEDYGIIRRNVRRSVLLNNNSKSEEYGWDNEDYNENKNKKYGWKKYDRERENHYHEHRERENRHHEDKERENHHHEHKEREKEDWNVRLSPSMIRFGKMDDSRKSEEEKEKNINEMVENRTSEFDKTINMSPSMIRFGKMDTEKKVDDAPSCGCGN